MELIVNSLATIKTSHGVRRLYSGIMRHLNWPEAIRMTATPRSPILARVDELLQRGRRDAIFWSPSHRGPIAAHNHVISVHDCINVDFTYRHDWRLPIFKRLFSMVLNNSRAVVALSNATRDSVLRNYDVDDSKILVIPAGYDSTQVNGAQAAASLPQARPFVLLITNSLPHKNTLAACRAFVRSRAAREGVVLKLLGSLEPGVEELMQSAGGTIEAADFIDDATLTRWYQTCEFLFSPTLAEGYNLPIAEALALDCNVLCSDIPVHHEFFSGRVTFFDPSSEDSMRHALDAAVGVRGRWHADAVRQTRSYADVAADYRQLFMRVQGNEAVAASFRG